MTEWRGLGLLILVIATSACGVSGPPFTREPLPTAGAVIYVYRPYHFFAPAKDPAVTCANETVEIEPGGYHSFIANPGPTTCSTDSGEGLHFDARAREEYYVREEVQSGLTINVELTLQSRADGLEEIRGCCQKQ